MERTWNLTQSSSLKNSQSSSLKNSQWELQIFLYNFKNYFMRLISYSYLYNMDPLDLRKILEDTDYWDHLEK